MNRAAATVTVRDGWSGVARLARRLRPGLRVQIALVVWLAVMAATAGARTMAVDAVTASYSRVEESARQQALASVRADWLANPRATAQEFGRRHSERTWTFAVWQLTLASLPTEQWGDGQEHYVLENVQFDQATGREHAPGWPGTGGWPQPWGTTNPWDGVAGAQLVEVGIEPTSFTVVLPRGDGTALVVSERYPGADWNSRDALVRDLDRQAWLMGIVAGLGAWLLSGVLMRPARRAAAVARRLGRGELGARVPVGSRDEVGQLGLALNDMAADLQRMVDAQRHFTSDTAHELRTPVAALIASASALENPATRDEAAGMVAPQLRRLGALTEDLLALARFDDDREQRDDQVVDLADLATRAAAQVAGGADVRVDADSPVFAIVDPARVATIVRNLVANGLRHGEAPVRVVVSERDGRAVVRVDDAGRGVPEHLRATIFDRFVRGDDARHGTGAGLGLAITRENAELHGGTLAVNDDGHGFVLELPLDATAARPGGATAVPAVREAPASPVRRAAEQAVTGLFCTAMVFLVVTPAVFGLDVQNDYGRLGRAVALVGLMVAAVVGARLVPVAPTADRWRRRLPELLALLGSMAVAGTTYRWAVAASLAAGWVAWTVVEWFTGRE